MTLEYLEAPAHTRAHASINFTKMPFQQQYHGLDSDSIEIETFDNDMAIIVVSRAENP